MSALLSFLITVTRVWGCVLAGANPAQVDETPRAVESGAADLERIDVYPASVELKSARSQVQLVVTGYFPDGEVRDITDVVRLKIEAPQFAEVVGSSLIPRADGQTQLKVVYGARQAQVQVTVPDKVGQIRSSFKRRCWRYSPSRVVTQDRAMEHLKEKADLRCRC